MNGYFGMYVYIVMYVYSGYLKDTFNPLFSDAYPSDLGVRDEGIF